VINGNLWSVEADPKQISHVINNLVINAKEAMNNHGNIEVSAENVQDNELSKKYVKIRVKDLGVGIRDKDLVNIFDPYFSTKEKNSGLGLSTAYSIIRRHNGVMDVITKFGKGAEFDFYLPACSSDCSKKNSKKIVSYARSSGKILIMDDEKLVRDVAKTVLKRDGDEILEASDGREALEIYQRHMKIGKPFDLVIMDLTIPGGMGGKETIEKLLKVDPGAKVIVSSGYSTDPIMANYRDYGFFDVLPKPYELGKLTQLVREVLVRERR